MATHDFVVANGSGSSVRQDLNNALAAIVSNNSSPTQPATTYSYMWWADTTAGQLKQRNSANSDWIVVRKLDGTMLMEDGTAAAPGLAFASDIDCGLFRASANQLGIATNGVERVKFGTSEVVFADVDFRVESDTEANLLKIDAGNSRIGIAESAPNTLVEIGSTEPYVTIKNSTEEDIDGGRESRIIFKGEQSGGEISTLAQIEVSHEGSGDDEKGKIIINVNSGSDGANPTEVLRILDNKDIRIGQSTVSDPGRNNSTIGAGVEPSNGSLFLSRADGPALHINSNTDSAVAVFRRSGSTVGSIAVSTTTTSYNTSSDYRLKENVVNLDNAIDRVKQLAPKRFNFIADPNVTIDGFLAHEAQVVVPESVVGTQDAVDTDGNPEYQGIDQSKLVPLLTAALQEAIGKIEMLEAKVDALEAV